MQVHTRYTEWARFFYSKSYYVGEVRLTVTIDGCALEGFCTCPTTFSSAEIVFVSLFGWKPKAVQCMWYLLLLPIFKPCHAAGRGHYIDLLLLILSKSFGFTYLCKDSGSLQTVWSYIDKCMSPAPFWVPKSMAAAILQRDKRSFLLVCIWEHSKQGIQLKSVWTLISCSHSLISKECFKGCSYQYSAV